ncbi:MAG: glycosyltransferase family 4 protein [Anaerolineae bacterium]|nr:glycosyltransferase family 4 protein [Anaerolineae bacterium]
MSPRLLVASGIFHPEAGGPATYLHTLLPALQQRGWTVNAITYGDAPVTAYPYPLIRIPRRALPLRVADYARAVRPLLQQADLTYIHSLGLPLTGGRAPRIVKIVGDQAWERAIRRSWVPSTEDIDVFQTRRCGLATEVQKEFRSREVRRMDRVIVPSEYLKRMVAGWGIAPERITVIYNALPPEPLVQAAAQAEARTLLGLNDEPLLLTAARLTPWKGIDHLLTALARVPEVRLVVAGDGPMRAPLEQQAHDLKLDSRVTFLGHIARERVSLYMKAADYFVLYSGYEGLPHTALESLRAGTPVIASDKCGNPEVVTHQANGLLVPYIDVEALAATITTAFRPGLRAALAAQTALGLERFDFARMIDQTDALLKSCLRS